MEIKKEIYISASALFLLIVFLSLFFVFPLLKEIAQTSKDMLSQIDNRILLNNQYNEAENFKQK
jgi:hypothetical protein